MYGFLDSKNPFIKSVNPTGYLNSSLNFIIFTMKNHFHHQKYNHLRARIKFYSNYFPLRLMYNGSKSQKVKKILLENGLKQEDWFLGGVG